MAQISLKSLMNNNAPTYAQEVVQPFRDELTAVEFKELLTPGDVDAALNRQDDKVSLVVLNSVCGCAAGKARPGVIFSLLNEVIPDECVTLFAGMEKEAVAHFREKYMAGMTPSSPNIALLKNGQVVHILERYQIEGKGAGDIARELCSAYDNFCQLRNTPEKESQVKNYMSVRYQINISSPNQ
jgi:putative YphP/YqiW family bacilliredoxin